MSAVVMERRRTRSFGQAGRWPISLAAMLGGALVAVGALMPWLSLLAGLQVLRGTSGANGWLLVAGGAVAMVLGLRYLTHGGTTLRWIIGGLGFGLLAFASWLLIELLVVYRDLQAETFAFADLRPGLFIVLGGAALVFATFFLNGDGSARRDESG